MNKRIRYLVIIGVCVLIALGSGVFVVAGEGGPLELSAWSFSSAGGVASSANGALNFTTGELALDEISSPNYGAVGGIVTVVDGDGDGIPDVVESCANQHQGQTDSNNDGQPDICDPVVTSVAGPIMPIDIADQPVIASGVFEDVDDDDLHTATWDWGDGNVSAGTVDQVNNSVSDEYSYADSGIYTVKLTVSDSYPASAEGVYEFIVIYDLDGGAGFVTGGGWIWSDSDACPSFCGGSEGKANFGFVSKYKKGASVPTGNTEFKFSAGGLNFHSDTYQWLVVNQGGTNAQFKGFGTINRELSPVGEAYKFVIWAKDLGPDGVDTFRIKIWYEDGVEEIVIYDNGFNKAVGGGNISIHDG